MAIFARTRERQGFAQDIIALQQYFQQQQFATRTQLPAGQAGPVILPQFPQLKSQAGAELFGNYLLQQQQIAGQPGFQLSPGQTRFTAAGQPIAKVSKTKLERELIQTQIGKNRAEAEAKLRAGKGILTPEQKISQTNIFRKEFDVLSKDFRIMRDSFVKMNAAAKDPSGAGDIALIFNFMKILDPNSVVRESEFATAENAASVPVAIRNLWNKALTGERIKFNRIDFIRTADRLMKGQQGTQKILINRYTKLSDRFGLNPQNIITEIAGKELQVDELSEIDREIAELEAIK